MPRNFGTEINHDNREFFSLEEFLISQADENSGLSIEFNRNQLDNAADFLNVIFDLKGNDQLSADDFFTLIQMHLLEDQDGYDMAIDMIEQLNVAKEIMDDMERFKSGEIEDKFASQHLKTIRKSRRHFIEDIIEGTARAACVLGTVALFATAKSPAFILMGMAAGIAGFLIVAPVLAIVAGKNISKYFDEKKWDKDSEKAEKLAQDNVHDFALEQKEKIASWEKKFKKSLEQNPAENAPFPVRLRKRIPAIQF